MDSYTLTLKKSHTTLKSTIEVYNRKISHPIIILYTLIWYVCPSMFNSTEQGISAKLAWCILSLIPVLMYSHQALRNVLLKDATNIASRIAKLHRHVKSIWCSQSQLFSFLLKYLVHVLTDMWLQFFNQKKSYAFFWRFCCKLRSTMFPIMLFVKILLFR